MNELIQLNNSTLNDLVQQTLTPLSIAQQQRAIEIRNAIKDQEDMPKYLLAIEVNKFLEYVTDDRALMLFQLLWNTGGRINEILALTPNDFNFGLQTNFVKLINLKRRRRNLKTNEDLVVKESYRMVSLTDKKFIQRVQQFINGHDIKKTEPIFKITARTANNWCDKVIENAERDGVTFSIPISPHTFRHSFAMHLLYNGIKPLVLQKLMGHSSYHSTQVYTSVLAIEAQQREIRFLV